MNKFFGTLTYGALTAAAFTTFGLSKPTSASPIQNGAEAARGTGTPGELFGDTGIFTTITNTLLFVIGALSVVMIIWGGIRYATSGGNAASVTAAKNTILYAIVGLIIAFLAFAAVNWVLGSLMPGADSNYTDA